MISPKGETDNRPRKFYAEVDVVEHDGAWVVRLDGKQLRTPEKNLTAAPTRALAEVLAEEWRTQGERIDFASMSAMRLANVAIDRAPAAREGVAAEVARYVETDLVCHLADFPAELRARQEAFWRPLRDWAAERLGVKLYAVEGVVPVRQPPESIEAAKEYTLSLDDFRLTALAHATSLFGSAVVGFALVSGRIRAAEGCEISLVDELFQIEKWGVDAEAERRLTRLRAEAAMLDRWFDALNAQAPA